MRRQSADVATNLPGMTNREELLQTVAVPVDHLRQIADTLEAFGSDEALALARSYIPKPKPRLVAVTPEQWASSMTNSDFDAQPDLLTLLDEAVESAWLDPKSDMLLIQARIRTALGVTE